MTIIVMCNNLIMKCENDNNNNNGNNNDSNNDNDNKW